MWGVGLAVWFGEMMGCAHYSVAAPHRSPKPNLGGGGSRPIFIPYEHAHPVNLVLSRARYSNSGTMRSMVGD